MVEESILDNGMSILTTTTLCTVLFTVLVAFLLFLLQSIIDFISSKTSSLRDTFMEDISKNNGHDNTPSSMDLSSFMTMCSMLCRRNNVVDDDELFKEPPPKEDCPICFLPMPYSIGISGVDISYQPCCGKMMCVGCMVATGEEMKKGSMKVCCPFCRIPLQLESDDEYINQIKNRMKVGDGNAFYKLGLEYLEGTMLGISYSKKHEMEEVFDLWKQGAEHGSVRAHYQVSNAYMFGKGVEKDREKAIYHAQLAAIGGHEISRHNLGVAEGKLGNYHRAYKHCIIAAKSGMDESLKKVGDGYKAGYVTKDEYATTLRAYQQTRDAMKSEQRARAEPLITCKR